MRWLALSVCLWALPALVAAQAGPDLTAMNAATRAALNAEGPGGALSPARAAAKAARASGGDPAQAVFAIGNLGYLLVLTGATEEGEAALREALARAESAGLAGAEPWYSVALNLARLEAMTRRPDAAMARLETLLGAARGGDWHGPIAAAASDVAFQAGRMRLAADLLEETIAVAPELLEPTFGALFTAYADAQEAATAAGRVREAAAIIAARIAILNRYVPDAAPEAAQDLLFQKFALYHGAGRPGAAADALREAAAAAPLSEEERAFVTEMAGMTLTLSRGAAYGADRAAHLGEAELAVAFAEIAEGPGSPATGLALRELAAAQGAFGRHEAAAATLGRALGLLDGTDEGRDTMHLMVEDLATNAWQRGDYALADDLFRRADGLAADAPPPARLDRVIHLTNRAQLDTDLGRPEVGLSRLETAHGLFEADAAARAHKRNERALEPRLHAAAARALADMGRTGAAADRARTGIAAARAALPEDHPDLATLLGNAADLLAVLGRRQEAEELLAEAIAINRAALPADLPDTATLEVNLALHRLAEGRVAEALPLLDRAGEARTSPAFRAGLPGAAADFELLAWARLAVAGGESDAAIGAALDALQWTQVNRSAEALAMMEARLAAADPGDAVLLRRRQDAEEAHARSLAQLVAAYAEETTAKQDLAALDARTAAAAEDVDRTEAALAAAGLADTGIAPVAPLSLAEIQALLGPDEALVTFLLPGLRLDWLEGSSNVTLVVTRDAVTTGTIPEARRGRLRERARAFRCALAVGQTGCVGAADGPLRGAMSLDAAEGDSAGDPAIGEAHALYADLFGDVEPALRGKSHLILVPPADLLDLPFAALATAPPGENGPPPWLIRRHALSVLPSIASLRTLRGRPQRAEATRFLGVGDPVIGAPQRVDCTALLPEALRSAGAVAAPLPPGPGALADPSILAGLARLPDTACELRAIARAHGLAGSDVLLAEAATEARVKALDAEGSLAGYDVIVFATHGLVAGEAGARAPGLVLTPPARATPEDDGFLTAAEIATLDLNARLVVLSACNTGAGEAAGTEGLSGLARAFFHAGAGALMVTHWSVYSAAATDVSTRLFSALNDDPGLTHAEALRRAMLTIIDDSDTAPWRRHPSYWAAFSIVGA